MAWLSPLWLAALATLAVPLVIHLRRRRIGRRLRVGSVRHLSGSATPRSRRLRIRDPWLLALRGAILSLVVAALAGPLISPPKAAPAHWTLIAPDILADSTLRAREPLLDSLRRSGTTVRELAAGFPVTRLGESDMARPGPPADLWSLLREADRQLPIGSSITVIVRPRLGLLQGTRPALAAAVSIRAIGGTREPDTRLEAGWIRGDSVTILLGEAAGGGLRYRRVTVPIARPAAIVPGLSVASAGDSSWRVSFAGDTLMLRAMPRAGVSIDTGAGRSAEARYLRAGFGAVSDAYGLAAQITTLKANRAGRLGEGVWTAWLDTGPPPLSRRGPVLIVAGARRSVGVARDGSFADLYGRPMADERLVSGGREITLGVPLDPRRSDFVTQPAFPELLAQLWAGPMLGLDRPPRWDPRPVAVPELAPARGSGHRRASGSTLPLRDILLALAALLFLIERLAAHRIGR